MSRPPVALLWMACGLSVMLLMACSSDGVGGRELPPTSLVASIDRMFKFDGGGSLPLTDRSELPAAPGAVNARWYAFRGWYVAVFDGLDLDASGPVCLGTSFLADATNQLEQIFVSPATEGACDGPPGGGAAPLSRSPAGVRACDGLVSYLTRIPVGSEGSLFATLTTFPGDGTRVGITGEVASTAGPPGEIDEGKLDCGPLPQARSTLPPPAEPTPTLTPAPRGAGRVAAAERAPPPVAREVADCVPPEADELQAVLTTDASPYFVHHPIPDDPSAPTVIFLPGGSGRRGSAERVWETIFAGEPAAAAFRVVIPYSFDAELIDDASRTFDILNEVLWCYGGDPWKVHLAGTSNGGLAAFGLMVARPEHFATLLGAPGAFPVQDVTEVDPSVWADVLAGRAVYNGVGIHDDDWRAEVIATHNALAAAGVESLFVEFPGQGHAIPATFDGSVLLDFWASH